MGGILGQAWELYTKFFTRFFVVAAIVGPFMAVALTLTYFELRQSEGAAGSASSASEA